MNIFVDADACPAAIKEIVFRAAQRARIHVTLVANQPIRIPASEFLHFTQVGPGFNAADEKIVALVSTNDLVISADVPLAAAVVEKGAHCVTPRGERFTADNIRERLSIRNFMDELRSGGVNTGGPAALSARDKQAFANQLDAFIAKAQR